MFVVVSVVIVRGGIAADAAGTSGWIPTYELLLELLAVVFLVAGTVLHVRSRRH
jgi:hypothetical protein